jgi:hypothetical protein
LIDGRCPENDQQTTNNKMNINRHNYEEYFILYMDNELRSDERRQVEDFIQKHPDLKEELEILLQYKMVPDPSIVFYSKEELMIHDDDLPITMANYEEWLTMYIDNELTPKQRTGIEQFVTANPQVKKELEILQQTKLQPEEIIFINKESLYRREEKVRMIPMRWWRVAAAAVLILAISLTTVVVRNKKSSSKIEVAKIPGNGQKINTQKLIAPDKEEPKQFVLTLTADNIQRNVITNTKQKTSDITVKRANSSIIKNLPGKESTPVNNKVPIIVENKEKPSNNLPQPLNNTIENSDASKTGIAVKTPNEGSNPKKSLTDDLVTTDSPQPSNIVYNQPDGKKSKLRGFLRKVTRTFEKNTNINATNDDDRILIGGLALKLN